MATTSRVIAKIPTAPNRAWVVSWSSMANGDDGEPLQNPGSSDRSVQVTGTFGAGGTVVIEGSNDGTTYKTLTDPQGNALSFTAASLEAIQEVTRYVRPRVTAGDGTTSLTVTICMTGNHLG